MNVIFLDFDGVLKNSSSLVLRSVEGAGFMSLAAPDRVCVKLMDMLCRATDARIVVSSSWRQGRTVEQLQVILRDEFGLEEWQRVVDRTRDGRMKEVRGDQIAAYVRDHVEIERYVIIDDDSDMLPEQQPHFIQIDGSSGFRVEHLDEAAKRLGVEDIFRVGNLV